MKIKYLLAGMIMAAACVPVSAQEPASPASDPNTSMAYDIARNRGLNVDQPRNLAKTVTVE